MAYHMKIPHITCVANHFSLSSTSGQHRPSQAAPSLHWVIKLVSVSFKQITRYFSIPEAIWLYAHKRTLQNLLLPSRMKQIFLPFASARLNTERRSHHQNSAAVYLLWTLLIWSRSIHLSRRQILTMSFSKGQPQWVVNDLVAAGRSIHTHVVNYQRQKEHSTLLGRKLTVVLFTVQRSSSVHQIYTDNNLRYKMNGSVRAAHEKTHKT
jgi:hypothetical protein